MIHAGVGYAQIGNFLTECNLPVMSKSCFQKHEKKIGKILVSAAWESCKNDQQLEKEISADKVILHVYHIIINLTLHFNLLLDLFQS